MTEKNELDISKVAERFDSGERMAIDKIEIGQWYWVQDKNSEWFACVTDIGSNYVEVQSPPDRNRSHSYKRVHFDEFETLLRYEPDADAVIRQQIAHYQAEVNRLMGDVGELTQKLGVAPTKAVTDKLQEGTNALVAVSSQVDVNAYKTALVEAQEKTLPDLFKAIENAHGELIRWTSAPTLTLQATFKPMEKMLKTTVNDRIHTLELYAGLTEEAVQVRNGHPASIDEKLRVMQRRFYMDEECLLSYEAGGMEMKDIEAFDAWLSQTENMSRILPFERCAVAFRVRRTEKERDAETLWQAFINIYMKDADKTTYLYIRNGEQLWRVNCDFDFGEKLVPDVSEFDPGQPMMVKMFGNRVDKIIPLSAWEVMRDEYLEAERKLNEQKAKNPEGYRPYHLHSLNRDWKEYQPFDPSNIYYDEAVSEIGERIKKYNRVAVIIQGLFDRSAVLHPHHRVHVWEPASFSASIELIYDATSLTYGEKPDFEAYRKRLNSLITADSVVTGQEEFWMKLEAERENTRQRIDHRVRNPSKYKRYRPTGNPGPGLIGTMADWKPRSGKATFKWGRRRQVWNGWDRSDIPVSITVPASNLLNVSAYVPGDYKQFFQDPRTRREYLTWAPLLLAAEDFHAGKEPAAAASRNSWS